MEQLFPWLVLIPALAIGAVVALVLHARDLNWPMSACWGAVAAGGLYGLILILFSLIYVRTVTG